MYEYIKGIIKELTPTFIVIENNGIGYFIHISLNSYAQFNGNNEACVFIQEIIREDAHLLFGFFDKKERDIFNHLISVSGVGANTARVMLSSLSPDEIQRAIMQNNVALLKSIKGIGAKTAERIIIDLRDKIAKIAEPGEIISVLGNTLQQEALSALVMLGFPKARVEKVIQDIIKNEPSVTVEGLVKESLKRM